MRCWRSPWPWLLLAEWLLVVLLALLAGDHVASAQRSTPTPIPRMATPTPLCDTSGMDLSLDAEEASAWTLINDYREQNGVTRLVWTPSLVKASQWMANDMSYVAASVLNHNDRTGRGPFGRMPDCGYTASWIMGENIAAGYISGAAVFNGWKNSPGHNYVMLLAEFRVGGIAKVYRAGSTWGTYWALDLGGAGENLSAGATSHPESTWRWACKSNLCERIVIGD